MKPVEAGSVKVTDAFWRKYQELVRKVIVPYQWEVMNDRVPGVAKSHAIANLRIAAGLEEGEFYGYRFQDSDVAKWLEAVAWCLATERDPELERLADGVIEILGKAQQPDGYLNSHFTVKFPELKWKNERESHELYVAGHLMEAAVAYYRATGKREFLDIMRRNADHIDSVFGPEEGKKHGYPGHQVTEMALAKLYEATGEERYLRLAKYFLDQRGAKPHYFELEAAERGEPGDLGPFKERMYKYNLSHAPVREQKVATGHAVRAVYMYAGMADVAALAGDPSLAEACRVLWEDVTRRQMFVTAGLGQQESWEGFSYDYDLPNAQTYNETCASIGLVFWAQRMSRLEMKGDYYDVIERALYNGILSGLSLDGTRYFYVNLLESVPRAIRERHDADYAAATRQGWFPCACCPPNIARLVASLGGYVYSADESGAAVHLYVGSETELVLGGAATRLRVEAGFPWKEEARVSVDPERPARFALSLRVPDWCRGFQAAIGGKPAEGALADGYLKIEREWRPGDVLELRLPMPVRRVRANPLVRDDAGKVALMRGPVVYCLEEADNGGLLSDIRLPRGAKLEASLEPGLLGGVVTLAGEALRSSGDWGGDLYRDEDEARPEPARKVRIKAVPYYAWDNRGENEMRVWINEE